MLVKGDYIRLVKPMGAFTKVGDECEVLGVYDGIIKFRFGKYHMGEMDFQAYEEHFEKVENKNMKYKVGDKVTLINDDICFDSYAMRIGDKCTIRSIQYGVIGIETVDGALFYIAKDLFEQSFTVNTEEQCNNSSVSVTAEQVEDILNSSTIRRETVFNKCMVVACQLPNGFVIVESSACVDTQNYDADIGFEICMKKIKDKIWELEGYRLQNEHPIKTQKSNTSSVTKKRYDDDDWLNDL